MNRTLKLLSFMFLISGAITVWAFAQEPGRPGPNQPQPGGQLPPHMQPPPSPPQNAPRPAENQTQVAPPMTEEQQAAIQEYYRRYVAHLQYAALPVKQLYASIFAGEIAGILGTIDFSELILNGYYLGGDFRNATETRRHDIQEIFVRSIGMGNLTYNQLQNVLNTVNVQFDITNPNYATFTLVNPQGGYTWGKCRLVADSQTIVHDDGTTEEVPPRWLIYAFYTP
ncbi:MAG: hypothetical protein NUW37_17390 [Planctomycetes bacterium]|nr:hypothetical protein [Planctomycetota bacterium]